MSAAASPPAPTAPLLKTPLHPFHAAHGAHLVPFAGWEMPLYYGSILAEHHAVRSSVGLFDVGHMGILTVTGPHAVPLLSRRTTANVDRLEPGQGRYTFLLDLNGLIVDDLLITRTDTGIDPARSFLVVPNAATAPHIFDLFREHRQPDTEVEWWNGAVTILAVQGPESRTLLESIFPWALGGLKFYTGRRFPTTGDRSEPSKGSLGATFPDDLATGIWVSRTGYTGELGYELFVRNAEAAAIADRLAAAGAVPCGLGARDALRLEQGYLLSGQDFHEDRTPLEAAQDRFVEFDHPFVGREALEKQKASGVPARLVGIAIDAPDAIPRHGTPILKDGLPVGALTSGGLSPELHYGIGLGYLPPALAEHGTEVELEIRGRRVPGRVVSLPFRAPRPSRR